MFHYDITPINFNIIGINSGYLLVTTASPIDKTVTTT